MLCKNYDLTVNKCAEKIYMFKVYMSDKKLGTKKTLSNGMVGEYVSIPSRVTGEPVTCFRFIGYEARDGLTREEVASAAAASAREAQSGGKGLLSKLAGFVTGKGAGKAQIAKKIKKPPSFKILGIPMWIQ